MREIQYLVTNITYQIRVVTLFMQHLTVVISAYGTLLNLMAQTPIIVDLLPQKSAENFSQGQSFNQDRISPDLQMVPFLSVNEFFSVA